jgi:protoporphyrinogen/coproporphyrinogen III oxidase
VSSIVVGDLRAELGAVFASPDYHVVLGFADALGVPYVAYSNPRFVLDEAGNKLTFAEFLLSRYTPTEITSAVQHYAQVLQQYSVLDTENGFADLPPELHENFNQFAAEKGFTPIAEMAKSLVVGFGYGYYETMPAAYVMKLLPWLVKVGPAGLESPPYFVFPTGYQSLWKAVAAQLNVRTLAKVTNIKRPTGDTGPIKLTINGFEKKDFDVVIISTPLNVVKNFMSLTSQESALFSKVKTERYFTTLFTALNLPGSETVFVHDNARPEKINHVLAWGNPGGSLPIYIAYQIVAPGVSTAQVGSTLAYDVLTLGGGLYTGALIRKEWDTYFPNVDSATMASGFFETVEGMQGNKGIFYVGGTLSFETVEHSARYAKGLVESYFPAVN